jgi:hypothetical protein
MPSAPNNAKSLPKYQLIACHEAHGCSSVENLETWRREEVRRLLSQCRQSIKSSQSKALIDLNECDLHCN